MTMAPGEPAKAQASGKDTSTIEVRFNDSLAKLKNIEIDARNPTEWFKVMELWLACVDDYGVSCIFPRAKRLALSLLNAESWI